LAGGEAVLRFPYDERLRQLLRAIPGRRWDSEERVWRVPLDAESAAALRLMFATVPGGARVTDALDRALQRRCARRRPRECVVDLSRPDQAWWLSFATDAAVDVVEALLEHPRAYELPAIGRALIPLDERAAGIVRDLLDRESGLRLTDDAIHALTELGQRRAVTPREEPLAYDVELRSDRRGGRWILIAAAHAKVALRLAESLGLRLVDGPAATLALGALERDGLAIAELLERLDPERIDPDVRAWLERATTWQGTIEVEGGDPPGFVLLGDDGRLPAALRERATPVHGGVAVPLTLDSWRLMDGRLSGWISHAAKRCVAALEAGQPAPPAVLERSAVHEEPTFVLAPGHDAGLLEAFTLLPGA
jgi:hypothetical protein